MADKPEEKKKWCPFLDKYCIGEKCALLMGVQQERMGMKSQVGVCVFLALAMIMSSRPQPPPQRINLPPDLKV